MDDLISRQMLLEYIHGEPVGRLLCDKYNLDGLIEQMPPAEPKRGRWIRTGSGSLYDHYECSECGKAPKWECMGDNRWKIAFTDFCPNCGAKMEGTT